MDEIKCLINEVLNKNIYVNFNLLRNVLKQDHNKVVEYLMEKIKYYNDKRESGLERLTISDELIHIAFLLSQINRKDTFSELLKLYGNEELMECFFGDIVTEELVWSFYKIGQVDLQMVIQFSTNKENNYYSRTSAITAIIRLAAEDYELKGDVIDFCEKFIKEEKEEHELISFMVNDLCIYGIKELQDTILEAFANKKIDTCIIAKGDVCFDKEDPSRNKCKDIYDVYIRIRGYHYLEEERKKLEIQNEGRAKDIYNLYKNSKSFTALTNKERDFVKKTIYSLFECMTKEYRLYLDEWDSQRIIKCAVNIMPSTLNEPDNFFKLEASIISKFFEFIKADDKVKVYFNLEEINDIPEEILKYEGEILKNAQDEKSWSFAKKRANGKINIKKNIESNEVEGYKVPLKKDIGRNDPCPCGSGKKYKRCCLKDD